MPRIFQIITHLDLGGAERVCFALMKGLRDRYDFALYAANGVADNPVARRMIDELHDMRVPLYVGTSIPIKQGGMLTAGWWGGKAVRDFSPDLIHLHTEIPEASYAAMVLLRPSIRQIPLVRTIHNAIYWRPRRWLGKWCERKMPRSYIAAVSEPALKAHAEVRAQSRAGELPVPARIILNGVSVDRVKSYDSTTGLPVRLLFAARFEPQKGADLLPQIIRLVRLPEGVNVELSIFGQGTYESPLRELARTPPRGWTITVSPPIPDLKQRMADFDLMLMPSRYEGLSLLAMESILSGLPVVGTRAPGLQEGFPPDYPWLAKPGDAADYARLLSWVLENRQSWPSVAASAMSFARKYFDVSVMCNAYDELYQQALRTR